VSRYSTLLLLLASIWGASYLFIKVAVEDIPPAALMEARTLCAALLLLTYLVWRMGGARAKAELRASWRHCLVLGVLSAAVPFWLIAWGEQHIDSGLAAVLQASVPIFNALLLLRFVPHERLGRVQALGLAVGILGVTVVTGVHPSGGGWAVLGALAVVVSSISYAGGGVYGQLAVSTTPGPVLAAGSMLCGALVLLPFALLQPPTHAPGWEALASLAALTLGGTALAQLILFRMLALHGSARLSLVTYLMPGFALVYGALILDEEITVWTLGGLALILGGVALASRRRARAPEPVPSRLHGSEPLPAGARVP
jgi:drug/metabolite transporter (DMT)-like permease